MPATVSMALCMCADLILPYIFFFNIIFYCAILVWRSTRNNEECLNTSDDEHKEEDMKTKCVYLHEMRQSRPIIHTHMSTFEPTNTNELCEARVLIEQPATTADGGGGVHEHSDM